MKNCGKVAVALLAGLAAGTIVGVLFAPSKGSDTREKLNDSLSDLADALGERTKEQLDQLNDFKEQLVSTVKSKFGKVEEDVFDDDEITEHA